MVLNLEINKIVGRCDRNSDGDIVYRKILTAFQRNQKVVVSFRGVGCASSSFVNSAFIALLDLYSFEYIKRNLHFTETNSLINKIIKKRFAFEVRQRSAGSDLDCSCVSHA